MRIELNIQPLLTIPETSAFTVDPAQITFSSSTCHHLLKYLMLA